MCGKLGVALPHGHELGGFNFHHLTVSWQIYSLFFQETPFPFQQGSDDIFIRKMVLQLGPLPREWQTLLEDMQRMNTDPQSESNIPYHPVTTDG